jgi:hypothetical protein
MEEAIIFKNKDIKNIWKREFFLAEMGKQICGKVISIFRKRDAPHKIS